MFLNTLCASGATPYIIDGVAIVAILISVFVCAKKGFANCFIGALSMIAAVLVAVFLTEAVVGLTGGLFGLQDLIAGKIEGSLITVEGFDADLSQVSVEAALNGTTNLSAVVAKLVAKAAGAQEFVPGDTLAGLVSETVAALAVKFATGVILFVGVKILLRVILKVLNGITKECKLLGALNALLGAAIGLLYVTLIISAVAAVFAFFPNPTVMNFVSETVLVKFLYDHNILLTLFGLFL